MSPLCIDLFCGLGGWTEGFLAEGYRVVGFDIEIRPYPAQLVIQDVLAIHGSQFRDAAVIVASPPCQKYSYLAMPWSRSKSEHSQAAKALRREWETNGPDNRLFDACFRIQREAIEATRQKCRKCNGSGTYGCWQDGMPGLEWCPQCDASGVEERYIPLIVENVRGAQPWVGRSAWNYGSFHLWGDVPALMPIRFRLREKGNGGTWFHRTGDDTAGDPRDVRRSPDGDGYVMPDGTKIGGDWFGDPQSTCRKHGSRSNARKMASAQIAKIPLPLAEWIAKCYYPRKCAP